MVVIRYVVVKLKSTNVQFRLLGYLEDNWLLKIKSTNMHCIDGWVLLAYQDDLCGWFCSIAILNLRTTFLFV